MRQAAKANGTFDGPFCAPLPQRIAERCDKFPYWTGNASLDRLKRHWPTHPVVPEVPPSEKSRSDRLL